MEIQSQQSDNKELLTRPFMNEQSLAIYKQDKLNIIHLDFEQPNVGQTLQVSSNRTHAGNKYFSFYTQIELESFVNNQGVRIFNMQEIEFTIDFNLNRRIYDAGSAYNLGPTTQTDNIIVKYHFIRYTLKNSDQKLQSLTGLACRIELLHSTSVPKDLSNLYLCGLLYQQTGLFWNALPSKVENILRRQNLTQDKKLCSQLKTHFSQTAVNSGSEWIIIPIGLCTGTLPDYYNLSIKDKVSKLVTQKFHMILTHYTDPSFVNSAQYGKFITDHAVLPSIRKINWPYLCHKLETGFPAWIKEVIMSASILKITDDLQFENLKSNQLSVQLNSFRGWLSALGIENIGHDLQNSLQSVHIRRTSTETTETFHPFQKIQKDKWDDVTFSVKNMSHDIKKWKLYLSNTFHLQMVACAITHAKMIGKIFPTKIDGALWTYGKTGSGKSTYSGYVSRIYKGYPVTKYARPSDGFANIFACQDEVFTSSFLLLDELYTQTLNPPTSSSEIKDIQIHQLAQFINQYNSFVDPGKLSSNDIKHQNAKKMGLGQTWVINSQEAPLSIQYPHIYQQTRGISGNITPMEAAKCRTTFFSFRYLDQPLKEGNPFANYDTLILFMQICYLIIHENDNEEIQNVLTFMVPQDVYEEIVQIIDDTNLGQYLTLYISQIEKQQWVPNTPRITIQQKSKWENKLEDIKNKMLDIKCCEIDEWKLQQLNQQRTLTPERQGEKIKECMQLSDETLQLQKLFENSDLFVTENVNFGSLSHIEKKQSQLEDIMQQYVNEYDYEEEIKQCVQDFQIPDRRTTPEQENTKHIKVDPNYIQTQQDIDEYALYNNDDNYDQEIKLPTKRVNYSEMTTEQINEINKQLGIDFRQRKQQKKEQDILNGIIKPSKSYIDRQARILKACNSEHKWIPYEDLSDSGEIPYCDREEEYEFIQAKRDDNF